jgi:hypothetical protein
MIGAMALGLLLTACAQSGFVDEGSEAENADDGARGGLAKSILISMGAIDDPHQAAIPKYQPRAPLVVPPQRNLPAPVDRDAALESKGFPVDPEVREDRERTARLKGVETAHTGSSNALNGTLTPDEQAKFKDLPTAGPGESLTMTNAEQRQSSLPLKPSELDGKAQAAALDRAENSGSASKQKSLLAPPADYRTPSPNAPLESPKEGIAAMKPGWWPF